MHYYFKYSTLDNIIGGDQMISDEILLLKPYKALTTNYFLQIHLNDMKFIDDLSDLVIERNKMKLNKLQEEINDTEQKLTNNHDFIDKLIKELLFSSDEEIKRNAFAFLEINDLHFPSLEDYLASHRDTLIKKLSKFVFTTDIANAVKKDPTGIFFLDNTNKYRVEVEAKSLFTELAKVNLFDHNDILRFCRYYGLPKGIIGEERRAALNFFVTSHLNLTYDFLRYKNTFKIFSVLKDRENSTVDFCLDNYISLKRKAESLNVEFIDDLNTLDFTRTNKHEKDCEVMLSRLLAKIIDDELTEHVDNAFVFHVDKGFIETTKHKNLFTIAYEQIKDSLLNNRDLRICDNCRNYFEVTHDKQSFCPPLPLVKRSSCEIAYYKKTKG